MWLYFKPSLKQNTIFTQCILWICSQYYMEHARNKMKFNSKHSSPWRMPVWCKVGPQPFCNSPASRWMCWTARQESSPSDVLSCQPRVNKCKLPDTGYSFGFCKLHVKTPNNLLNKFCEHLTDVCQNKSSLIFLPCLQIYLYSKGLEGHSWFSISIAILNAKALDYKVGFLSHQYSRSYVPSMRMLLPSCLLPFPKAHVSCHL